MVTNGKCVLCGRECEREHDIRRDVTRYNCTSCGEFVTTSEANSDYLSRMAQELKQRIAACTRERNIRGLPELWLYSSEPTGKAPDGANTVEYVLNTMFPSRIQDRFDRVLRNFGRMTPYPGAPVILKEYDRMPVAFAESEETSNFILKELENIGYIRTPQVTSSRSGGVGTDRTLTVTAAGIARMQQLEESEGREQSFQAFVAMWFDKSLDEVFDNGIKPAADDCGFKAFRVDVKETNQKVCDEIIAEIRRSRFLIADCTGSRGGVYFEAGFAMGLGIPVIWTCRNEKDDIDALHFDTRQYAHVLWDNPEDLRQRLRNRIAATIPGAKQIQQKG